MKRLLTYIKILLVAAMLVATQQSCTKLDEEVYSEITGENLFANPDNLIYAFGVAYTNLYQLFGHKYGGIGIDCGTDVVCVPQRGGDWQDGWMLFADNNKDGSLDEGEEILTRGQVEWGFKLSYRAFGSFNHLRFTPMGFTLSHNGTFKLCPADDDPRYARVVIISKTARIRLSKDADGDGIYEDASGKPLVCP